MSVHLQLCIKMFAVAGHRFYFIYKLGDTEHPHRAWHPSFPHEATRAPREPLLGPLPQCRATRHLPPVSFICPSAPGLSARARPPSLLGPWDPPLGSGFSSYSQAALSRFSATQAASPAHLVHFQHGHPALNAGPTVWRGLGLMEEGAGLIESLSSPGLPHALPSPSQAPAAVGVWAERMGTPSCHHFTLLLGK